MIWNEKETRKEKENFNSASPSIRPAICPFANLPIFYRVVFLVFPIISNSRNHDFLHVKT